MVTYTTNKGYGKPTVSGDLNAWGPYLNTNFDTLDLNLGGTVSVNVAGSADVTLSASQAKNLYIKLTGLLTGNITVFLPAAGSLYVIENNTTGAFSITLQTTALGGNALTIQGRRAAVVTDGTDVVFWSTMTNTLYVTSSIVAQSLNLTTSAAIGTTLAVTGAASFGSITGPVPVNGTLTATGVVGAPNIGRGCVLALSATQSIPNNSETAVTWPAAVIDDASCYSAGQPTRITIPAGYTRAMFSAQVAWDFSPTNYRQFRVLKNGTADGGGLPSVSSIAASAANFTMLNGAGAIYAVTPGDYFQLMVYQNCGASLNLDGGDLTWFGVQLLR